jgi:prepilin-type N-terminal cleavage/methylation domain-containing protein
MLIKSHFKALSHPRSPLMAQLGVTLIEMMIALVVGLIVSAAALVMAEAILKSNGTTIRATALTQELRATAEVVSRDIRRARGVADPISNVDLTPLVNACNAVNVATAGCITFAYNCASGSGTFKSIGLAGGKVRVLTSNAGAPACPTAATGTQLSSSAVTINRMTFTQVGATDAYTLRLTGQFITDPSPTPVIRTISQEVRVRSAQVQ